MRAVSIILIILSLFSCKAKRELVQSEKTDSIRITEQYREQTVKIPGDSLRLSFPLIIANNRPRPSKVEVQGDRSSLKVEVTEQGNIEASANCDEYEAKVMVLERTVERSQREISLYKERETALQRTIKDLKAFLKYGAIILVILAILKFAKPIYTLLKNL